MKRNIIKKLTAIMITAAMMIPTTVVYAEEVPAEAETVAEAAEEATEALIEDEEDIDIIIEANEENESEIFIDSSDFQADEAELTAPVIEETELTAPSEEAGTETEEATETEETSEETESESEEAKAEEKEYRFENEEVVITAKVINEEMIPENAEFTANKLSEDSEKYQSAKRAAENSAQTTEENAYSFYEVYFTVDGEMIRVDGAAVEVKVEFKNGERSLYVKDGEAKDVTDTAFNF